MKSEDFLKTVDKRAAQSNKIIQDQQAQASSVLQTNAVINAITQATKALITFQSKHQPQVSVTNQKLPTSIKTPDIQQVVDALENLKQPIQENKTDDQGIIKAIQELGIAISKLPTSYPEIPEPVEEVTVKNQPDYKSDFDKLSKSIEKIDVKPVVNIPEDTPDDYTPILDALSNVVEAVKAVKIPKVPTTDLTPLVDATDAVQQSIKNLKFPVANYVLPFKDTDGKATQVQLQADGSLPITASISTGALATSANQTNGTQLTQIVDAGGDAATVTGGKLDVNASFSPSGTQDINITEVGGNAVTDTVPTSFKDIVVTGTLTIVGDTVQISTANGFNCVGVTVTGTFGGATIIPEESADGVRFDACTFFTVAGSTPLTSTGAVGTYQSLVGGMSMFRVRLSTLASGGPITITLRASRALTSVMLDNGLPTGSNTIGNVGLNAGTNQIGTVLIRDTNGNIISTTSSALDENLKYLAGTGIDANTGNASAGTQRVVLATDQPTVPVSGTVNPSIPTIVQYGQQTVSVTNTAIQLTNQTIVAVVVQALAANAGNVVIGDSSVTTGNGFQLQPGQATGVAISNVNKLYVNGTSGDGVCWIGS